jgi:hypothetical protein
MAVPRGGHRRRQGAATRPVNSPGRCSCGSMGVKRGSRSRWREAPAADVSKAIGRGSIQERLAQLETAIRRRDPPASWAGRRPRALVEGEGGEGRGEEDPTDAERVKGRGGGDPARQPWAPGSVDGLALLAGPATLGKCPTMSTARQSSAPVAVVRFSGARNGRMSGRRCAGVPSAVAARVVDPERATPALSRRRAERRRPPPAGLIQPMALS